MTSTTKETDAQIHHDVLEGLKLDFRSRRRKLG
jgi:hypothetical protein